MICINFILHNTIEYDIYFYALCHDKVLINIVEHLISANVHLRNIHAAHLVKQKLSWNTKFGSKKNIHRHSLFK